MALFKAFPKQALVFKCLQYKSSENTMGKGEIAHNEQFLLFSHCFLDFRQIYNCHLLLTLLSLKESKICRLGKGKLFNTQSRHLTAQ